MSEIIYTEEKDFEDAVIKALIEYGWEPDVIRYPTEENLIQNWADILFNNNKQNTRLNDCPLTAGEMDQIINQVKALQSPVLLNEFINGRSISITRDNPEDQLNLGKEVSLKIYDRQEIALGQSRYQIVQQPQFKTKSPILNDRRGDLMLLINGMPVIHLELKRSGIPVSEAYNQIQKYSHEGVFRGIFSMVQIFVAMQPKESVYFANPGEDGVFNKAFYFHWADFNNNPINDWHTFVHRFLSIPMAHMLIGFYTIADTDDGILKVMRSYQYYAAVGIANIVADKKSHWDDGKQLGGHIWHTTGSGKTMTSFKAAQLIASNHDAEKVVFLVDRKELGIQSLKEYRSFASESESVQATENTTILTSKLKSDDLDNTLIVTSIQKLSNITAEDSGLNDADLKAIQRKRIVIIIDECHRSTFGDMLIDIKNTFKNAIIFGFTGTPIQDLNAKKDSTTPTIFGDEIHRYTLGDGIRDKNVLGFDPYLVRIYDDNDLREQIALEKAKASSQQEAMSDPKKKKIFLKYMDSSQVKMYGDLVNGKWISGIEDYIPNEQYQTPEYKMGIITDIKKKWPLYSRDRQFHAIFATSSIPEAVEYYRLMVKEMQELMITAMFDPSIDNDGGGSLEKEDGIVEMLEAYNSKFSQSFSIASYDKFRKDVSLRMSHKKPYERLGKDEQIDILIVVNQMLTGFDSKWVNTLYLDKVMEYENLIQAFSRTNRLYDMAEKPFGIIKYYRRPNTMEKNIEAAVKAYSGDIPTGLFVDKLPNNLRHMNTLYLGIEQLFKNANIESFEKLPEDSATVAKFAKDFKLFVTHLEAALIQGFVWSRKFYPDENQVEDAIEVALDEMTYLTLLARYKELSRGGGGGRGGEVPYEVDIHITEYDTGKIDANYMNSNFDKYVTLIQGDTTPEIVAAALKELHRSFSMLSQEEQRYADRFIHAVENGKANLVPGKTFRQYIADYMKADEYARINRVVKRLGCSFSLIRELLERKVNSSTLDNYGKFTELKNSVNRVKAREFFKLVLRKDYIELRLPLYSEEYLRAFLLSGGQDPYLNVNGEEVPTQPKDKELELDVTNVGVVLTEKDYIGKKIVSTVKSKTLHNWYSESKAVESAIKTDCFAYVDNKVCLASSQYIQRTNDGHIELTEYAKAHEEECFLQFIVDENDGKLHYVKLPASKADVAFKYYDEISEELLNQYGLVNEMSKEMLKAIEGVEFGSALTKLMDKNICNCSGRLLKSVTGLDVRTISNMKKGENLTKLNVVSACLGIHIPFRVSDLMLQLADLSLNMTSPGKIGADNETYDMLLHLKWATDYEDVYDELKEQSLEYLIHQPPL